MLIATLNEVEMLMSWSRQLGQVAGAVIEACPFTYVFRVQYIGLEMGLAGR